LVFMRNKAFITYGMVVAILLTVFLLFVLRYLKNREKENAQLSAKIIELPKHILSNSVPYFIVGDLDNDRQVTKTDLKLLQAYLEKEQKTDSGKIAAADWSGDGLINQHDLAIAEVIFGKDGKLLIPKLTSQNKLPCDYSQVIVWAPAYVKKGETISLQFPPWINNPVISFVDNKPEAIYDTTSHAYLIDIPANGNLSDNIDILISLKDDDKEEQFDLAIPLEPQNQVFEIDNPTKVDSLPRPEEDTTCPQYRKGCEVLIIDFEYNNKYKSLPWIFRPSFALMVTAHVESLVQPFKDCGCNVTIATPDFDPVPQHNYKITLVSPGHFHKEYIPEKPEDSTELKNALAKNDAEWKNVVAAIAVHHAAVQAGKELTIEILNGHGDNQTVGCLFETGPGHHIVRNQFHLDNYKIAKGNTCFWFNYDFSCHSGWTPKIIDELENTGMVKNATFPDGNAHAAWGVDYAYGICKPLNQVTYAKSDLCVEDLEKNVSETSHLMDINAQLGKPDKDFSLLRKVLIAKGLFPGDALYTDKGYQFCNPHVHVRQGY